MVPHNTVITPSTEKNVIKVATKKHKDKLYFKREDTMVTEKGILEGKCGPKVKNIEDAIIPRKASVVPKDKFVYKFYDDDVKKYPGFHKEKTPSGLCLPCCYNFWSTNTMKKRRDICQGKNIEKEKEKDPNETNVNEVLASIRK